MSSFFNVRRYNSCFLLIFIVCVCLPCMLRAQADNENQFLKKQQTMAERWELDPQYHKGNFIISAYKPVFVTAGRWSDNPNEQPTSENPAYTLPFAVPYNNYEAKFQF